MDETTSEAPKKGNSMMILGVIVVLIVIGIAAFMMSNRSQSSQTADTTVEEGQAMEESNTETVTSESRSTSEAMTEESTVKTFEMEAGSFYYSPKEIRVKKGDKVKIVINSVDMMHDFNIDELNIKIPVTKSGETNSVEFTADTTGEFEFYCSVGEHRANGQVGTLIVEE